MKIVATREHFEMRRGGVFQAKGLRALSPGQRPGETSVPQSLQPEGLREALPALQAEGNSERVTQGVALGLELSGLQPEEIGN